jgi:hypothetical protein
MHTKYTYTWKYYSIYQITCKDPEIKEGYVGKTYDLKIRKSDHQQNAKNENHANKLYSFIRAHGGFDNFKMKEVERIKCNNDTEARIKEKEWCNKINSQLNSISPYGMIKNMHVYVCSTCNYSSPTICHYNRHMSSKKHTKYSDDKLIQNSNIETNSSTTFKMKQEIADLQKRLAVLESYHIIP